MTTPKIKSISVNAVFSLDDFLPEMEENFWCNIDLLIGEDGVDGGQIYQLTIGTPSAFSHAIQNSGPKWGRHHMIVNGYDPVIIRQIIEQKVSECARPTWDETYKVLARHFGWEFEDYGAQL